MMRENITIRSINNTMGQTDSHDIYKTSTSADKQRISTLNIRMVMTALASIPKKAMNKVNNNNIFMFLLSVIGLSLLSLSVSIIITTNAQASSDSTTYGGSSSGNRSDVTQMGICMVGAGGPCNGDSNWDGRHDMTRQCKLSNRC